MTKPKMALMHLDSDSVLGELGEPLDNKRHGSLSVVSTSPDLNRLVFVRGDRLCSSVTHVVPFDLTMLEMDLEGILLIVRSLYQGRSQKFQVTMIVISDFDHCHCLRPEEVARRPQELRFLAPSHELPPEGLALSIYI